MSIITLGGKTNGRQILSPEMINLTIREQAKGVDAVVEMLFRFGIGHGLTGKDIAVDLLSEGRIHFWEGIGGSIVILDLDRRVTISYAMNKLGNVWIGSERTRAYVKAIYTAI
jgi:CubicO group peptidase (beta-lactamase class C family)